MVRQALKFSGDVGTIVVKPLGLVVAETRVVHRAAIRCVNEREEAVLAITQIVDGAALGMHAYQAIDFADPSYTPSSIFHRVDVRHLRCRQLHGRCEREVASRRYHT